MMDVRFTVNSTFAPVAHTHGEAAVFTVISEGSTATLLSGQLPAAAGTTVTGPMQIITDVFPSINAVEAVSVLAVPVSTIGAPQGASIPPGAGGIYYVRFNVPGGINSVSPNFAITVNEGPYFINQSPGPIVGGEQMPAWGTQIQVHQLSSSNLQLESLVHLPHLLVDFHIQL